MPKQKFKMSELNEEISDWEELSDEMVKNFEISMPNKKFKLSDIFDLVKVDLEPKEFSDWHKLKAKLGAKNNICKR